MSAGKNVHINCDLGEGGGFDEQIMPFISACNIACGGHAGNRETVVRTVELALKNKVQIGAHPSYPDKENFGRYSLPIEPEKLRESVRSQILLVKEETENAGGRLHHVKPHGALYNDLFHDEKKAVVIVECVQLVAPDLILYAPPGAVVHRVAENRLKIWTEIFADRGYNDDFTLVSRERENALLHTPGEVLGRVLQAVVSGTITTVSQKELKTRFDTMCLHSDTPNPVQILSYLQQKLSENHIHISK